MTADVRVIGIDPGPTPGIVVLDIVRPDSAAPWIDAVEVAQCSPGLAVELVHQVCASTQHGVALFVQVEKFVTRGRANKAQQITRDLVPVIRSWVESTSATYVERPAVAVKPWATDARLDAATSGPGLLQALKGMTHARDAARHALFCAVHDAGLPDPLSKAARR